MSDSINPNLERAYLHAGGLTELSQVIHKLQVEKGFWDKGSNNTDQKLLLITGEICEAHEELRSNDNPLHVYYRDDGKPEGFTFELADVLIRTLDLCGSLGIDVTSIVAEKLRFNESRPRKHGRLF